jgi:hypothetical protein
MKIKGNDGIMRCGDCGKVVVTKLPKPRISNPSFLSDELADWQAKQTR